MKKEKLAMFKLKVLSVEDNVDDILEIESLFDVLNHHLSVRKTNTEAFDLIVKEENLGKPFDLILLDYDLSGELGTELAKKINEKYPELPMLLITDKLKNEDFIEISNIIYSMKLNILAVVPKDVISSELVSWLDMIVAHKVGNKKGRKTDIFNWKTIFN